MCNLICCEYLHSFTVLHYSWFFSSENVLFLTKVMFNMPGCLICTFWITADLLNPFCSSSSPQMFCTDLALGRCLSRLPAFMCSLQGSRAPGPTDPLVLKLTSCSVAPGHYGLIPHVMARVSQKEVWGLFCF